MDMMEDMSGTPWILGDHTNDNSSSDLVVMIIKKNRKFAIINIQHNTIVLNKRHFNPSNPSNPSKPSKPSKPSPPLEDPPWPHASVWPHPVVAGLPPAAVAASGRAAVPHPPGIHARDRPCFSPRFCETLRFFGREIFGSKNFGSKIWVILLNIFEVNKKNTIHWFRSSLSQIVWLERKNSNIFPRTSNLSTSQDPIRPAWHEGQTIEAAEAGYMQIYSFTDHAIYVCIHTCIYIYRDTYTYMYVYTCKLYMYMHVHMHIHMYMCVMYISVSFLGTATPIIHRMAHHQFDHWLSFLSSRGKPWENQGKTMGKWWFNGFFGDFLGFTLW